MRCLKKGKATRVVKYSNYGFKIRRSVLKYLLEKMHHLDTEEFRQLNLSEFYSEEEENQYI